MTDPITVDMLEQLGYEVRGDFPVRIGNCRTAALQLQNALETRYEIPADVREVAVGDDRQTHFVVTVPCEYVTDCEDDGRIIVDPTLDQFCSANQDSDQIFVDLGPREYIDDVGIYPPGVEEREVWYFRPNDPPAAYDDVFGDH